MRYRTTTLRARQTLPAIAGTEIIDIPITDVISAFRFHLEVLTDATNTLLHIADVVSKIEIVDGSDVLMELAMDQMEALHFYERGQLGNFTIEELGAKNKEFHTAVYFGRYAFDKDLALDPGRFSNPQLRITYNAAVFNTGVVAGGIFMTVLADIFDELRPSPIGFLQHREFYRYSPAVAGGGIVYINLPTDLVIRKLFIQPKCYRNQPDAGFAAMRLDEDNMKRIPVDILVDDWVAWDRQEYGPVEHQIVGNRESGFFPLYHAVSQWAAPLFAEIMAAPVLRIMGVGGCRLVLTDAATEDTPFLGRIIGQLPHFVLCYPFGDQKDLADWYETKDIGTLRLRITDGATIGAAAVGPEPAFVASTRVILQQLRRY